jgi:hypothetical protein
MKIVSIVDEEWAMAKLKDNKGFIPLSHIKPIMYVSHLNFYYFN